MKQAMPVSRQPPAIYSFLKQMAFSALPDPRSDGDLTYTAPERG
jgi:hypothetical protein